MKSLVVIFSICLISCASKPKITSAAPLNLPRPNVSKSTDKLTEDLKQIKQTIDSADARVERIKGLIETLNHE